MTKLLITPVTLKANLFAAAVALACGNTLPVVLISTLFGFIELDAGPVRQEMPPGDERRLAGHNRGIADDGAVKKSSLR